MPYSLKNLPPLHCRYSPPKLSKWFVALLIIITIFVLLMRLFGKYVAEEHFWLYSVGVPVVTWLFALIFRGGIWLAQDIIANGADKRREYWILNNTRVSRRSLQILNAEFISGHGRTDDSMASLKAMLSGESIIRSITSRDGKEIARHSRVDYPQSMEIETITCSAFSELLRKLELHKISNETPIVIAFATSSSFTLREIVSLWLKVWARYKINNPVEYVACNGLNFIERWLNDRINDDSILLIIAMQISPRQIKNSAEAFVALLLGNRLTQKTIKPVAFLHRPDPAPPGELGGGMRMAAYNVPITDGDVTHLWLAGLSPGQPEEVIAHQNDHPAKAIDDDSIISLDVSMGNAGAAAPWLAIAAATKAAQEFKSPQMIISGDYSQDLLWSSLITNKHPQQERDT